MKNYGKEFENKVKTDIQKIPNSHIERIYDSVSGYKSISGRSDFVFYWYPNQYWLETKSHRGNTFPWSDLRQYNALLEVANIKGIRSGVILWMIDHDTVIYLPIITVKKMKEDGKKSFHIKDLNNSNYRIIQIPSKKKRIFMDSDYSVLKNLQEGD